MPRPESHADGALEGKRSSPLGRGRSTVVACARLIGTFRPYGGHALDREPRLAGNSQSGSLTSNGRIPNALKIGCGRWFRAVCGPR